jgi:acyl-CoA synthetase (AMP-forming)/AMP-acid ligase II
LHDSDAQAFVLDHDYVDLIDSLSPHLPCLQRLIVLNANSRSGRTLNYEALLHQSFAAEPPVQAEADDVRALAYTSGTTGKPKGAVITQRQMLASLANNLIEIPVPRERPALLVLPFFTGYGAYQIFCALYTLSPMIIHRHFEAANALQAIERHSIAQVAVVPTMLVALCNAANAQVCNLKSLELLIYGGSVIAPTVLRNAMRLFKCGFCQVYGMVEAGGYVMFLTPEDHAQSVKLSEKRLLSTGRAAQYAQIRLVDEQGHDVPAHTHGELIVKSDSTVSGYWKQPQLTDETIREGWLYTGDIAYQDEDGYIYLVDRKKEMVISGGVNIYPSEVEAVLYRHPAVSQAAVIGVPDEYWGEALKAVVELKKGVHATEREIIEFCQQHLAGHKKPKTVDFVDRLPVSSTGKVSKVELRKKYWSGLERKI